MRPNLSGYMPNCLACNAPKTNRRCLICRKNKYYQQQNIPLSRCKTCAVDTRLASNGDCAPCLKLAGMKECGYCKEIGIALLDFKTKQAKCRRCRIKQPLSLEAAREVDSEPQQELDLPIQEQDYATEDEGP